MHNHHQPTNLTLSRNPIPTPSLFHLEPKLLLLVLRLHSTPPPKSSRLHLPQRRKLNQKMERSTTISKLQASRRPPETDLRHCQRGKLPSNHYQEPTKAKRELTLPRNGMTRGHHQPSPQEHPTLCLANQSSRPMRDNHLDEALHNYLLAMTLASAVILQSMDV